MTSTPTPSATGRLTKRMDIPELPRRLYTSGEEPEAHNSISYHTDNSKLHTALRKALTDDEFEELKESSLGVFIKFKEQGFGWASRLVHYMLSFKLDIKKKYEMWSLVGPEPLRFSLLEFENLTGLNCEYIEDLETPKCDVTPEMVSFWGMLGVHLEAGPTTDQIIAALKRCGDWSREDRKRLAYLSIFTGFIEGRKFSTATRSTLARLVMDLERFENYPWGRVAFKTYTAMPELGASIGGPRADSPSPPILAYEGSRGRRSMKAAILSVWKVFPAGRLIGHGKWRRLDLVKARKMEKTSQDVQVHPNQMDARGKDKDACGTVRMNVELVGEDGLWFGRLGRLDVVPAEAPIGTHAERLGQSDRYGRMNEPRSNCSERPDLHAGWLQWTDPRTRAHHLVIPAPLSGSLAHCGGLSFGLFGRLGRSMTRCGSLCARCSAWLALHSEVEPNKCDSIYLRTSQVAP
uniref:DUF1985 domain-containing protein n=1 Tax=Brassica oleracea var. oleracea TaxID=109376 RepID=A0A0D3DS56_BRAOL